MVVSEYTNEEVSDHIITLHAQRDLGKVMLLVSMYTVYT